MFAAHRSTPVLALCALAAGLTVASGAIHLYLWDHFYRHITTGHMNALFLVQWILCFVGAVALLVMRNLLAVLANAALLAGTFIGFLIAKYHHGGLFGFAIPGFSSWETQWTTVVEIAGTVVLVGAAAAMARRSEA
ncbi:MAG TPA: hypothetical protein VG899_00770 [Mycobacteriales bacterium]|nr:hypothetical protein [Mycobacteriales bacterium]HWB68139.1 hypothetical protein [Mycobacteriales bacterium]